VDELDNKVKFKVNLCYLDRMNFCWYELMLDKLMNQLLHMIDKAAHSRIEIGEEPYNNARDIHCSLNLHAITAFMRKLYVLTNNTGLNIANI